MELGWSRLDVHLVILGCWEEKTPLDEEEVDGNGHCFQRGMRAQRQCHVFAKFCLAVSSEERLGHRYRYATIVLLQPVAYRHQSCSSAHVQYQFSKSFKVFKTLLTRRESQWVWKNYESLNCVLKTKSISKTFARVGRFQNTAWVQTYVRISDLFFYWQH